MTEEIIEQKHWIWINRRIKKLPHHCKKQLVEMAKDDVKLCIINNGIDDQICQDMAEEVVEMEEYLW